MYSRARVCTLSVSLFLSVCLSVSLSLSAPMRVRSCSQPPPLFLVVLPSQGELAAVKSELSDARQQLEASQAAEKEAVDKQQAAEARGKQLEEQIAVSGGAKRIPCPALLVLAKEMAKSWSMCNRGERGRESVCACLRVYACVYACM